MFARANGSDVDVPTFDSTRAQFDAWLVAEPESAADPAKYALMQALGLR